MKSKLHCAVLISNLLCLGNAAFAAKIVKANGQVVEGEIQGRIAIKSTTATVTYQGKEYLAVFYVLIDGKSILQVDSKDVTVTAGQFTLLTVNWEVGGNRQPPSDPDALATAIQPLPRGFPFQFGYFDSGAQWAKLSLSSSSAGSVNEIFAYPTKAISSTSVPGLLAKPTMGKVLGEYPSPEAGLLPALQVSTSGGMVRIPVADLVAGQAVQIEITKVLNAASSQEGAVAPGEFVSIYGSQLGPAKGISSASLEKGLGGVKVTFGGIEAYLTYASGGQVNALVPYSVVDKADAVVEFGGLKSAAFPLQVAESFPAIFTKQYGAGPAWVANQDNTFNSESNPAAKGSYVAFWATGQGLVDPAGQDGEAIASPKKLRLSVKVSIGGVEVTPNFAGLIFTGVMQVNLQIPDSTPSGNVELLLTIGSATSRKGVTIAVK